jgi:probable HAF family extracellular repeat protein
MRVRTRVTLAFVGAAIAVAPAVAQVTITNLPSFHYTWTGGEAINASGQVAGWATTLGPPSHAMRWTDGVPLDLGALCADCNSQATNINADGDVVGWSTTPDAIFSSQVPVIWRNGVIAALPLPDGDTRGSATGINDAGTVVGTTSGPSGNHAVIWQNGLPEVIGLGFARAINNVGQIIGSITGTGGVVIEADGSFSPLPRLPGACGTSASPIAINDAGQVVGSTSGLVMMSGFCLSVSVVWTNGSVALLPLPSGATSGFVRGINNHGDFVGEISIPGKPPEAYLWRDGDIIPLGALPFTLPVASTAARLLSRCRKRTPRRR